MLTQEEYNNIKIGDIIIAKRPNAEKIKKGHQYSPHIVMGKIDNDIICLQGSSKEPKNSDYYKISKLNHAILERNGYYRCDILYRLSIDNCSKYVSSLTKNELEEIKRLIILNKCYIKSYYNYIPHNINLYKEGDIICYQNLLYLIVEAKDNINCLKLSLQKNNLTSLKITINRNDLYYEINNLISLPKTGFLIGSISLETLKNIKKSINENQKQKDLILRGSIIKREEDLYYVYNATIKEILASPLDNHIVDSIEEIEIEVNNQIYYVDYTEEKLLPNDSKNILIDKTSEEKSEIIKISKKSYKKTSAKIQKTRKSLVEMNKDRMSIVQTKTMNPTKYIVLHSSSPKTYNLWDIDNKKILYDCYRKKFKIIGKINIELFNKLMFIVTNIHDKDIMEKLNEFEENMSLNLK